MFIWNLIASTILKLRIKLLGKRKVKTTHPLPFQKWGFINMHRCIVIRTTQESQETILSSIKLNSRHYLYLS